jgi:hypothetical protein
VVDVKGHHSDGARWRRFCCGAGATNADRECDQAGQVTPVQVSVSPILLHIYPITIQLGVLPAAVAILESKWLIIQS